MAITKEKLKKYFKSNRFDVRTIQIINDLKIIKEDFGKLIKLLDELIEEKWIRKSLCIDREYEYDPGEKQDFGGIML